MPNRGATGRSRPITIGTTSTRLIAPDEVMRRVENFYATEEGSYITGRVPAVFHPRPTVGGAPAHTSGGADAASSIYGDTKGIAHCRVNEGQRELLILHTDNQIWEYRGWLHRWLCIIGPASESPLLEAKLPLGEPEQFPTQFVSTPTGIVIIPQGSRAYFYDGKVVAPLGYDRAPSPPSAMGPESSSEKYIGDVSGNIPNFHGVNDIGYATDGLLGRFSGMSPVFKHGRIGTVQTTGEVTGAASAADGQQIMGYLLSGRWRTRAQWVDLWGNQSPWSGPSEDVTVQRQPSTGAESISLTWTAVWQSVDRVRKQFVWTNLPVGREGTIGRGLARTRDLENSGTASYFELPLNSAAVTDAFATIPDNVSKIYPDNIPDAWLGKEIEEIDPVPTFKLATIAFGRMWIANWPGGEGAMRPSKVGVWGTFEANKEFWPDPVGSEITGLHAVPGGLLALTLTSTFLVTPSDTSGEFKWQTISSTQGCVAPSSIASMRNGMTVWLGQDGFYGFDGSTVSYLWEEKRADAKELVRGNLSKAVAIFDPASGEYRCWTSSRGAASNTTSHRFDGASWRTWREVHAAHGACLTKDHTSMVITCGTRAGTDGVWVQDRGPTGVISTLETAWIRATTDSLASIRRVRLWVRELGKGSGLPSKIQVLARRDWRSEFVSLATVNRYPDQEEARAADPPQPSFADEDDTYETAAWRTKRPFWAAADLDIPSCEVFQLKITSSSRFEILGFTFETADRDNSGARGF